MILVTGGLGFIGSNFVNMVLAGKFLDFRNTKVVILDSESYASSIRNLGSNNLNPNLKIIKGDVRDAVLVDHLVSSATSIVHFAAESHVDRSIREPNIFIQTNIVGTTNLVAAADRWKKRIVIVSTDEVYGSISNGEADEFSNLNPSSPYSASKAAADLVAISYFKTFGTDVIITRSANNYGPNQHLEKFIPTVINCINRNLPIPLYGNGRNIRNWIHVSDHCSGIISALQSGESGEVYNFGTSDYLENIEICKILLAFKRESFSKIQFVEDRKAHDFRYGIASEKARNRLGWLPSKTFRESIGELFENYAI